MRKKGLPWNEWKILIVIKTLDGLIDDESVIKYVNYRLGLRSKATEAVVLSEVKVLRKKLHNKQEVLDEKRNEA